MPKLPLPPGSLSLLASFRALGDRDFYRRQAALHGPIFKMAQFHKPVICVTEMSLGHRILRDHDASIGSALQVFTRDITGGFLRYMDHEQHRFYGPLFRRALAKPILAPSVPTARAVMHACLPQLTGQVPLDPFLLAATRAVFARALFGIEPGTPAYDDFRVRFDPIGRRHVNQRLTASGMSALRLLRAQLRTPPAAVCALSEIARIQDGPPDDIALDNLLFIHRISANDASGLMVWVVEFLGRHPEWLAQVRRGDSPDLPLRIIKETVRLARSEYLYRVIRRPFDFEGFRFPARWMLRICVAEAHRDPRFFPEPDTFNPDRFLEKTHSEKEYSPFGTRDHTCKGVDLAILIATALIEELAPYDIVLNGSGTRRRTRHWNHWMPASQVTLVPHDSKL